MKIISTLSKIYFLAIVVLMVSGQQGCNIAFPDKSIIDEGTNTDAYEGQHKIVLDWMKQNEYRLSKDVSYYTLRLHTTALTVTPANDPEAWTKAVIKDLALTMHHGHFVIQIKDVGEAAFTLDENEELQPYDLTDKEQ